MRGKYENLIDAETWAFIDKSLTFYPADADDHSIAEQREFYNNLCKYFHAGYPDGVTAHDEEIPGKGGPIPIRRYHMTGATPAAQVVYYHGGGYVVGGLHSHDDVCAEICARTGFPVTSIDYRLAPENAYPDDFNDALAGFEHAAYQSDLPVIVTGDSAGGNLSAAISHATRTSAKKPVGQVLIYPALDSDLTKGTYIEHAEAPMLTTRETVFYKTVRVNSKMELLLDPTCNPLNDTDYSGLPPTVIISAQCDPLSGDGNIYQQRIEAAGGKAVWFNEIGLIHGYLRARHSVKRARTSFTRIIDAINALGRGNWPY